MPKRDEILRYYQPFRNYVMPMYPIVPDPVALETSIRDILSDDHARSEPQEVAVVLACLALGAQFAEIDTGTRHEISRDFVTRSNAYLQQSNYVFNPSIGAVQTLLMIGIALQNLGQSEGAWTLLGLNYRLAQSLGLHTCSTNTEDGQIGGILWTAILWQDSLLSLRYDRTPLSYDLSISPREKLPRCYHGLYFDLMSEICWVGIDMLRPPAHRRSDPQEILKRVQTLEDIVSRGGGHLHPDAQARTLQQKLEYLALRLHSSLLAAESCRPGFPRNGLEPDSARWTIRQKGVHYLITVLRSYLEICTFSNVPLRLWSMTQAALSCALVLALLDAQRPCETILSLLRRLVEALKMDAPRLPAPMNQSQTNLQGLCLMRAKAASLLESILANEHNTLPRDGQEDSSATAIRSGIANPVGNGAFTDLVFSDIVSWPTEVSLFDSAFANSVLDFDLDQGWFDNPL